MPFFTAPTSFRLASAAASPDLSLATLASSNGTGPVLALAALGALGAGAGSDGSGSLEALRHHHAHQAGGQQHPDFGHLTLLVMEAVLEVVFVALPGYIVARAGMFDAEMQKFVANLNMMVFLPCLIFTKLASQLTAEKLAELAVIPVIFLAQTLISWAGAWLVGKLFRFKGKRPKNFLTAMAVFGNSNSLPISLVISLSHTISGLHWSAIPGDNDSEVASRGILYLLIFQQLGQLVRWTWGYNVLLRPREAYEDEASAAPGAVEEGRGAPARATEGANVEANDTQPEERALLPGHESDPSSLSGARTPRNEATRVGSSVDSSTSSQDAAANGKAPKPRKPADGTLPDTQRRGSGSSGGGDGSGSGSAHSGNPEEEPLLGFVRVSEGQRERLAKVQRQVHEAEEAVQNRFRAAGQRIRTGLRAAYRKLPASVRRVLGKIGAGIARVWRGVVAFMNPPLAAMLVAVLIASIPPLQAFCFRPGTFVNNTVVAGIRQTGGVAVPLILVVLGANLARNTVPSPEDTGDPVGAREDARIEGRLLVASILARMVLPIACMAPLLALAAKYLNVSILDDPIFVIVCFLLTGAPSALQLAQICQINNVYTATMAKLLFHEYVIWILPSTLVLVMLALEVVEWAA